MSKASDDIQERELHQLQLMQENAKESCMPSFRPLHSFLQYFMDYDSQMTEKVFAEYTRIKVTQFRETLLQHMGNVKTSVAKRAHHQRQYQRRVNNKQMRTQKSNIDSGTALDVVSSQALDADLVIMGSNGTESGMHDTSSSSGNYITHVVDANIKPVNDQVPFAEVYLTAQHNVLANEQQHTDQSEPINDTYMLEKVDSNSSLGLKNMSHRGGEIDQDAEHDQVKRTYVDTKFAKPSILGKPVLQPYRNQSVVRQPTAFKSERCIFSKPRFASQVDVIIDLSKPVTPHYVPKVREFVFVKPHHLIVSGSSRNSSNESYGSNDMAHKYYLEVAKKKTQEKNTSLKPSVRHTTSLQNTTNGSKPKPRSNNQTSRSFPVPKSSCGMSNGVPLVAHSRNSSSFSDSKQLICLTCQKCVFNANHDYCITKFLKKIAIGQRFSLNKSSVVRKKPSTPRSCIRWIPTGRIFKNTGLRWIPTGNMFTDNITKVDNKPLNGSNEDITNPYKCKQSLDVSAGLVQNSVSLTPYVPPSKKVYEIMFQQLFDEYFNPPPHVVSPVPTAVVAPRDIDPGEAVEASKRRRSLLDYKIQLLSKGSSEGSGIIPEVLDEPKDNSCCSSSLFLNLIMKFKMSPMMSLTLSSTKLEIQSMVDVPIHQEDPAIQRTPLINTIISMVTDKIASTPTPPTTQARVQIIEGIAKVEWGCVFGCDRFLDTREGEEEGMPPQSYIVVFKLGPLLVKVWGTW
nr:hypothetical protein [Tanacetum cinerariifolium]